MDIFYYITGCLLTSATLIAGGILKFFPPKKINPYAGIKTKTTSKNQKAWDYAHKICADTLLIYSLFSVIFYAALLVVNPPFIRENIYLIAVFGFALAVLGVAITAVVVESKTKKFNAKEENKE